VVVSGRIAIPRWAVVMSDAGGIYLEMLREFAFGPPGLDARGRAT